MEKKNLNGSKVSKVSKVIKLNINYVRFIGDLIKEKVESENRIKELYSEKLNLRFNNIERVNKRNLRKDLKEVLEKVLKEEKISLEDYKSKCEKVVNLSKNKSLNYIEVRLWVEYI